MSGIILGVLTIAIFLATGLVFIKKTQIDEERNSRTASYVVDKNKDGDDVFHPLH